MNPRRRAFPRASLCGVFALALFAPFLPAPSFGAGTAGLVGLRQALDQSKDEASLRRALEKLAPLLGACLLYTSDAADE